jgi:hypothetical protein
LTSARRQLENLCLVQPGETRADTLKLHPLLREFLRDKLGSATDALVAQDSLQKVFVTVMLTRAQLIPEMLTWEMIQRLSFVIPHLAEVAQQWTTCLDDNDLIWPFVSLGRFYDIGVWRILYMAQIERKETSVYAMDAKPTRTSERICPCSSSWYTIRPHSWLVCVAYTSVFPSRHGSLCFA